MEIIDLLCHAYQQDEFIPIKESDIQGFIYCNSLERIGKEGHVNTEIESIDICYGKPFSSNRDKYEGCRRKVAVDYAVEIKFYSLAKTSAQHAAYTWGLGKTNEEERRKILEGKKPSLKIL